MGVEGLITTYIAEVPVGGRFMLPQPLLFGNEDEQIRVEVVTREQFREEWKDSYGGGSPLTNSDRGFVRYLPPPRKPMYATDEQQRCWILPPP